MKKILFILFFFYIRILSSNAQIDNESTPKIINTDQSAGGTKFYKQIASVREPNSFREKFYSPISSAIPNNLTVDPTGTITLNTSPQLTMLPVRNNTGTDNMAPSVTSITRYSPNTSSTNANVLEWEIVFSEEVNLPTHSDFSLSGTTATLEVTPNDGTDGYIVRASGGDLANFNGDVTLNVGTSITDILGNLLESGSPTTGDNEHTFTLDNRAPSVTSITRHSPNTSSTNADVLEWEIVFSEAVNPPTLLDFSLSGTTATLEVSPNDVTGGYIVRASGGDLANFNGDVTLSVGTSITDILGNLLESGSPTTGDNEHTFTLDNRAPSVTSITRHSPNTSSTNADVLEWEIVFSEAVNPPTLLDFSLSGTTATLEVSPNDVTDRYIVRASGEKLANFNGNVILSVGTSITDILGNLLESGSPTTGDNEHTFTLDNRAPSVTSITRHSPNTSSTNADVLEWEIVFSEAVNTPTFLDFSLSGTTATLEVSPNDVTGGYIVRASGGDLANFNGNVTLSVRTSITDILGNLLESGSPTTGDNEHTFTLDNRAPSVTSITRHSPNTSSTNADVLEWEIVFSEAVNPPTLLDFSLSGTTATLEVSPNDVTDRYIVRASGGDLANFNGDVTLSVRTSITDILGHPLERGSPTTGDNEPTFRLDNEEPEINSIVAASSNPYVVVTGANSASVVFDITFSEHVKNVTIADFELTSLGFLPTPNMEIDKSEGTTFKITVSNFKVPDHLPSLSLSLSISQGQINIIDEAGNSFKSNSSANDQYIIINPEPAEQPTSLSSSSQTKNSITLNWLNSTTDQIAYKHLILIKESTSPTTLPTPVDGTFMPNRLTITPEMVINIEHGVSTYTVSKLNAGISYDFAIYAYTNDSEYIDYKTTSPLQLTERTKVASMTTLTYIASSPTISSIITTEDDASSNFSFSISDDGGELDNSIADNARTVFSTLSIVQGVGNEVTNWTNVIAGATLSSGGIDISGQIQTDEIVFSNLDNQLGIIEDNANKTYEFKVWLKKSLPDGTDNQQLIFRVDENNIILLERSSKFKTGESEAISAEGNNKIDIKATDLRWVNVPDTTIGVRVSFPRSLSVIAVDINMNRDADYTSPVGDITNAGLIVMNNTPSASFIAGIVQFSANFNYENSGDGRLTIKSGNLNSSTSNAVLVRYANNTIMRKGGFTEPNIISSINTANVGVFEFEVEDDAPSTSITIDDKVPTRINEIIIRPNPLSLNILSNNWSGIIENVELVNGSSKIQGIVGTNTNTITFSSLPNEELADIGYIADNDSKLYKLEIKLKSTIENNLSNLIDNKHFNFEIKAADISLETSSSILAPTSSALSDVQKNKIEVIATELRFEEKPMTTYVNQLMSEVEIETTDKNGNRDIDYNGGVSITSTGDLLNTVTANLLTGVGSATDITHTSIRQNLRLEANEDLQSLTPHTVTSNLFNIIPGEAESEVVADNTFNYGNINYINNLGVDVLPTNPKVFQFKIKDGGTTSDADRLPTNVILLSLSISNSDKLESVAIYDNNNTEIEQVTAAPNIQFTFETPLVIADNNDKTYHLRATYKEETIDNTKIKFTLTGATADDGGSTFRNTDGSTEASVIAQSGDNIIEVIASKFRYSVEHSTEEITDVPYRVSYDENPPVIEAIDGKNNLDKDFDLAVSFTNNSASLGKSLATSPNTVTREFVEGKYTYNSEFKFSEYSESRKDVIITVETQSAQNAEGHTYPSRISINTKTFEVVASESSLITLSTISENDATFDYIEYLDDFSNFRTTKGYNTLAYFTIQDEDVITNFLTSTKPNDYSPTRLVELTINITNGENIKAIALLDGTTYYEGNSAGNGNYIFRNLSIEALDTQGEEGGTGIAEFSVIASYKTALNNPNEDDGIRLQVSIVKAVNGRGSIFEDSDDIGDNDAAGLNGIPAQTDDETNIFNVRATKFMFTNPPSPIEGVDLALVNAESTTLKPIIEVRDLYNNLDLDYDGTYTLSTINVPLNTANIPAEFTNGKLDISEIKYNSIGNGSIIVNGVYNTLDMEEATSTPTTNVVDTELKLIDITHYPTQSTTILQSDSKDETFIGFELEVKTINKNVDIKFSSIKINFTDSAGNKRNVANILENIRLYKVKKTSTLTPIIDKDYVQIWGDFNTQSDFVVMSGVNDILSTGSSSSSYVVVANVTPSANKTSGNLKMKIEPSYEYLEKGGSMRSSTIESEMFNFLDSKGPLVIETVPKYNSLNHPYDRNLFTLKFNEFTTLKTPVKANTFELHEYDNDRTISDSADVKPLTIDANNKEFSITFYKENTELELTQGVEYYITLKKNRFEDKVGNSNIAAHRSIGLTGRNDIETAGFWAFTTTDNSPPSFIIDNNNDLIKNTYEFGFDLEVELDKSGTVYAVVKTQEPSPEPDSTAIKNDPNKISIDINSKDTKYYIPIRTLNKNTDYYIYLAAKSLAGTWSNTNYETTAATEIQKIVGRTSSQPHTNLVLPPVIDICVGEFQETNIPIIIIEANVNDFKSGQLDLNLPANYIFDTESNSYEVTIANAVKDITIEEVYYRNSSTFTIELSSNGGNTHLDEIRIMGLSIRALPNASDDSIAIYQNITSFDNIPYSNAAAILKVSNLPEAEFELTPSSLTINSKTEKPVALTQKTPVDFYKGGSYMFEGNGVNIDSIFIDLAGLGKSEISLTQTFQGGCQAYGAKTINVIDQQFVNLNFTYCSNDDEVTILRYLSNSNGDNPFGSSFNLVDFDATLNEQNSLGNAESFGIGENDNYIFNPGTAYPTKLDSPIPYPDFVAFDFLGKYKEVTNPSNEIEISQIVRVFPAPEILISSSNLPDEDNDKIIEACEYFGVIKFNAEPEPVDRVSTGEFKLLDFTGKPVPEKLTDLGDGNSTINTQDIANDVLLGSGTYKLIYQYTNITSTCRVSDTITIVINEKPVAEYTILGKEATQYYGCLDELIVFNNEIDIEQNPEGDPLYTFKWDFDDENSKLGNLNESEDLNPSHTFTDARSYNVSLITITDKGCMSDPKNHTISIGKNPATTFDFEQIAVGTPTILTNTTPNDPKAILNSVEWTINGELSANIMDVYSHTFLEEGRQEVILSATTDRECIVNDTAVFFTVPKHILNETTLYSENFDDPSNSPDEGGWVAWGVNSSWGVGSSGGDIIKPSDNLNFWVTGVDVLHNNNEDSYVYSPVFDISNLERPMIEILKYANLNTGNGVVIEYNNQNLSGSSTDGINNNNWNLLGTINAGEGWYNFEGIGNLGGNIQRTGQYGWSGLDNQVDTASISEQWKVARYILDDTKNVADNGSKVQFRVAFRSGDNNLQNFNGFAFDNVIIGNRNRIVLLENFTSSQQSDGIKEQNTAIKVLSDKNTYLAVIQYQLDVNGKNPIGATPDANTRAAYYGVGTTPRVAIDGTMEDKVFTAWAEDEYNTRALDVSPLSIETSITGDRSNMEIQSTITAHERINENYSVYTAVVENLVTTPNRTPSNEVDFNYVIRQMLPSVSGKKFTQPLEGGTSITINNTWSPTKNYNQGEFTIIVFVQDDLTREIYQSQIVKAKVNTITSLDEELNEKGFAVWPNPADNLTRLHINQNAKEDSKVVIFNQLGQTTYTTQITRGTDMVELDTKNWIEGVYYIKTEVNGETFQERILIKHN